MDSHEEGVTPAGAAALVVPLDGSLAPHPFVWMALYVPFGAFGGFVGVALTFLATKHGLSISEGALFNGAQLLSQWLKWSWAPLVDLTLSPRGWYVISTGLSALGVVAMSAVPLGPGTLGILLAIVALASLVNSFVGMSVEAMIAGSTPPDQIGRVSAWFQAGNVGGAGLGGGLGLLLVEKLPRPWMSGAIIGGIFLLCCLGLAFIPGGAPHARPRRGQPLAAVKEVVRDLRAMLETRRGVLSAVLCVLPISTGAAQGTLTQAKVAAFWSAGADQVALTQGFVAGFITAIGCFVGGYLCEHLHPRTAYASIGLALAGIAVLMGVCPATARMYVLWSLVYAFAVGLAFAAFTALVLDAMGRGSAATKYNVFASLANFPLWWLGLLLGVVAEKWGARRMLFTEAGFGVLGVIVLGLSARLVRRSRLMA